MKVMKTDQVPKTPATSPLFTGGLVTQQALITREMGRDVSVTLVNFGKGARNKWHTHSGDQVLIVTSGKGTVATEKQERSVETGHVILVPAGEKHWHGAARDSEFSHFSILPKGSKLTQFEE